MRRGTGNASDHIRDRYKLEIALHTLNDLLDFKLDASKPVAEMVRMKMKIRKAFDDMKKLEAPTT